MAHSDQLCQHCWNYFKTGLGHSCSKGYHIDTDGLPIHRNVIFPDRRRPVARCPKIDNEFIGLWNRAVQRAAVSLEKVNRDAKDTAGTKLTGGDSPYYLVKVKKPSRDNQEPYTAECTDIIESLEMNFNEGNAFKALWRMAAKRLGGGKPGTTRLYDAEKVVYFGGRIVEKEKGNV